MVLSTETKTEITEQMTNLFDYLRQNASVDQPYFDTMVQTLPQGGEGCVLFTMNGQKYYLIYQPLGLMDWSIIGIVPTGVVDAGMRKVQSATILVIALLGLLIIVGVVKIQRDAERSRRRELERCRETSDMMFAGMARVVERYLVCDLDRDRYQYHERRGEPLYPPEGSYRQMLEQISRKYVVLTDTENAKITQMLAPENLRRLIKTDNDSLKLEYAARDKSAFFMMTVVPMAWKGDRLTRVMIITQDMGKQHLLQSLANTDGLTGLLNKRYFDRVLTVLEQHSQPFALFYMDLDRFKPVNDTYGHDVGDELLKGVSQRLQGCIRSRDYAFRLGGDEFALLLLGPMKPEACASKMNMICEMVAVPYEIDGNTVSVGASCGYALYPAESVDVQQVRYIADQRMYENKHWGVIVNGTYKIGSNTRYAKAAGGFAGSLCGAVLGEKDTPGSGIHADKIRSVIAGEYAGGCFGIADVSGAANISANGETSVLQYLLKLGKTDVLDAFRSYVYYGNVTGDCKGRKGR